jgi:ADP-ribose pyrophosphatase YjhB (NUDIX family)
MGSGVLFTDATNRVLLVEPAYKDYWEIPGGVVEINESPRAAAEREIEEELGLHVSVGKLLVVDWLPPRTDRTEGVMFLYAARLEPAQENEIRLPPAELHSWAWCDRADADARLSKLLARRVTAAQLALAEGTTAYLEDGMFVS